MRLRAQEIKEDFLLFAVPSDFRQRLAIKNAAETGGFLGSRRSDRAQRISVIPEVSDWSAPMGR